jgi:hypothetical protein
LAVTITAGARVEEPPVEPSITAITISALGVLALVCAVLYLLQKVWRHSRLVL